jgi:hypothetical protein
MGKKLPPDQLALYKRIDDILWSDWDPIGVSKMDDWPRDEYQGYLPHVFSLALKNASAEEIGAFLHEVASKRMGLGSKLSDHLPIAEKIVLLGNVVSARHCLCSAPGTLSGTS